MCNTQNSSLKRINRDMTKKLSTFIACYSCQTEMKLEYYRQIYEKKNSQGSVFMKIHPLGAELFHADGQTDGHDEANSRFSYFSESA